MRVRPVLTVIGVREDDDMSRHPSALLWRFEGFQAKLGQSSFVSSEGEVQLFVGLGVSTAVSSAVLRHAALVTGRRLAQARSSMNTYDLAIRWQSFVTPALPEDRLREVMWAGIRIGSYTFAMRDEVTPTPLEDRTCDSGEHAGRLGYAVNVARDLINLPASALTPNAMAQRIRELCEPLGIRVTETRGDALTQGFGALAAVGRGSPNPPVLLELAYGSGPVDTAFVGKGITYDSGGLSLKSAESLMTMKSDMAGAAAIVGLFVMLAANHARGSYVGVLALAENMPGPHAIRPGDVVQSRSGKLIEILDTDFEGRVVLADAVTRAGELHPARIIDVASLTYAAIHALGEDYAALVSDNDPLARELLTAGSYTGETLWRMPLQEQLASQLESAIADVKNHPQDATARTSTAALFVREFVAEGIEWAHIDMLGPGWRSSPTPTHAAGGTGFGVHLLTEYVAGREQLVAGDPPS